MQPFPVYLCEDLLPLTKLTKVFYFIYDMLGWYLFIITRSRWLLYFWQTTLCDAFLFFERQLLSGTSLSLRLACTSASSSHARHLWTKKWR